MNECVNLDMKSTNDTEDKIEMLALCPLIPASLCPRQHFLEVGARTIPNLKNCKVVFLNLKMRP